MPVLSFGEDEQGEVYFLTTTAPARESTGSASDRATILRRPRPA